LTDRGGARDGFIYKSAKEWNEETGLTPYAVNKARKKLQAIGMLETKKKRANGSPTIHYRLNKDELISRIIQFLADKNKVADNTSTENEQQPVESNPKPQVPKYVLKEGVNPEEMHEPVSFLGFLDYCKFTPKYIDEADYFTTKFENKFRKKHPLLPMKQWMSVYESLSLVFDDSHRAEIEVALDQMKAMIDKYFKTDFQDGCDYSILNFNTKEVKKKLFNDIQAHNKVKGEQ